MPAEAGSGVRVVERVMTEEKVVRDDFKRD
jgi:hypothetical protein